MKPLAALCAVLGTALGLVAFVVAFGNDSNLNTTRVFAALLFAVVLLLLSIILVLIVLFEKPEETK